HTIKPIDATKIVSAAKLCGAIVTAEEHQIMGGMGSAVAELLAQKCPVPIEFVGVKDHFGESGPPHQLMQKFGLTSKDIVRAVKKAIRRRN
ncbi:MAG: transketolase C-terminal domain-containing protein, partial [Candidatus Woesearchaeota archaeon]|nr:transketolase C-terminal domain-containing protein [Candidatus Woesearchaeota archaeon]